MPQSDGSKTIIAAIAKPTTKFSQQNYVTQQTNLEEWKSEALLSVEKVICAWEFGCNKLQAQLWQDAGAEFGTTLPDTLMWPGQSWPTTSRKKQCCAWWKLETNNPTSWSLQDKWHFYAFWEAGCLRSLQLCPDLSNPCTLHSECCISWQNHIRETENLRSELPVPQRLEAISQHKLSGIKR